MYVNGVEGEEPRWRGTQLGGQEAEAAAAGSRGWATCRRTCPPARPASGTPRSWPGRGAPPTLRLVSFLPLKPGLRCVRRVQRPPAGPPALGRLRLPLGPASDGCRPPYGVWARKEAEQAGPVPLPGPSRARTAVGRRGPRAERPSRWPALPPGQGSPQTSFVHRRTPPGGAGPGGVGTPVGAPVHPHPVFAPLRDLQVQPPQDVSLIFLLALALGETHSRDRKTGERMRPGPPARARTASVADGSETQHGPGRLPGSCIHCLSGPAASGGGGLPAPPTLGCWQKGRETPGAEREQDTWERPAGLWLRSPSCPPLPCSS